MVRSGSTSAWKQTSRPPARAISDRIRSAACPGIRRGRDGSAGGGASASTSSPSTPTRVDERSGEEVSEGSGPGGVNAASEASGLELLLLRSRKQNVVEDQTVPRRVRVQVEIGGRIADLVLLI